MNTYLLGQVLEEARRLQPAQISYETDWKMVEVLADKLEYEHKAYSNHCYEKHVGPDIIKMPPSHAKEFQSKGLVQIYRSGSCDVFKIHGLLAYRPWQSESEEASANRPGPELVHPPGQQRLIGR